MCEVMVLPRDLTTLFQMFLSIGSLHRINEGCLKIWHTVIWSILKSYNDIVFSNKLVASKDLEDLRILLA